MFDQHTALTHAKFNQASNESMCTCTKLNQTLNENVCTCTKHKKASNETMCTCTKLNQTLNENVCTCTKHKQASNETMCTCTKLNQTMNESVCTCTCTKLNQTLNENAGWLAMLLIKAGDVETNPDPNTSRKQVWICDICHRQIQVRKQISIRCNMIEHWVHLRCAGIRLA